MYVALIRVFRFQMLVEKGDGNGCDNLEVWQKPVSQDGEIY